MEPTEKQKSIFDGLMLSDIGLELGKCSKNARIGLTCKHLEFAEKCCENLNCFDWSSISEVNRFDSRTGKIYHSCRVKSLRDEWLTSQHSRWYVNGCKIIPTDLNLDADTITWWYIGDGHLHKKKSRPNYRRVVLATDCFTSEERIKLVNQLTTLLGNGVYVEGDRTIIIGTQSLVAMATLVGTVSPVVAYQYKFDWGNYANVDYFQHSYNNRPLKLINEYRKKNKIRELNYKQIKSEN